MTTVDLQWWIQVIMVPVTGFLFATLQRHKSGYDTALKSIAEKAESNCRGLEDKIAGALKEIAAKAERDNRENRFATDTQDAILRDSITKVQLKLAEEYVHRTLMIQLEDRFVAINEKTDTRLGRIEEKIDRLAEDKRQRET